MHLASERGCVDVARMLVECSADVSAQAKDGSTPLHWASLYGYVDVAWMLVERGADVSAQAKDGSTPLHWVSLHRLLCIYAEFRVSKTYRSVDYMCFFELQCFFEFAVLF